MTTQATPDRPSVSKWHGLGHWNFYFIAKLLLFWFGYINFDPFYNAVFAAALLLPMGRGWVNRLRHLVAIPFAIALLYHDTWFPPFNRLLAQPEIFNFSTDYLIELLGRFVNWHLVAAGFLTWVVYLFIYQLIRLTTFSVTALGYLLLSSVITMPAWFWQNFPFNTPGTVMAANTAPTRTDQTTTTQPAAPATAPSKPDNALLNKTLDEFFSNERNRRVSFPEQNNAPAFDILFINICSLSWSDLDESRLINHPLFRNMDIIFDNFNAATAYSGPAVLRLLRASCGQTPHSELYKPVDQQCYLFENLRKLGFTGESALNHNGEFQGFLDEVKQDGQFPDPYIPKDKRPFLTGFDGSPIWNDLNTLESWWSQRLQSGDERKALFYNTITLHDGNREPTADGGGKPAPFDTRAQQLLDELDTFITELSRSGRRVLLVMIPEHGAGLKADKMQISGMREIPTRDITHIPVGVRLIGTKETRPPEPIHISAPSSYLALSELVSRIIRADVFEAPFIDWQTLISDLPTTTPVSENEGSVVMDYNNTPYVRIGDRNWLEYPR